MPRRMLGVMERVFEELKESASGIRREGKNEGDGPSTDRRQRQQKGNQPWRTAHRCTGRYKGFA